MNKHHCSPSPIIIALNSDNYFIKKQWPIKPVFEFAAMTHHLPSLCSLSSPTPACRKCCRHCPLVSHSWSRRRHGSSTAPERWRPPPSCIWTRDTPAPWCRWCDAGWRRKGAGAWGWGRGRTASPAAGSGGWGCAACFFRGLEHIWNKVENYQWSIFPPGASGRRQRRDISWEIHKTIGLTTKLGG